MFSSLSYFQHVLAWLLWRLHKQYHVKWTVASSYTLLNNASFYSTCGSRVKLMVAWPFVFSAALGIDLFLSAVASWNIYFKYVTGFSLRCCVRSSWNESHNLHISSWSLKPVQALPPVKELLMKYFRVLGMRSASVLDFCGKVGLHMKGRPFSFRE